MRWTPADVVAATSGRVGTTAAGLVDGTTIDGATIDSRRVSPGMLFVPILAARDGHEFIPAAIEAGAGAYLYGRGHFDPGSVLSDVVGIEVVDTGQALLDLGGAARARLPGAVIGITGSVGKTSTKDLSAAALADRWRVAASERSFNNELGVPLTLINASPDTEVAVIEMGARGVGHIARLSRVVQPTVGVVTAVAAVHTELFGSVAAVAEAKGELVEGLGRCGVAVLNADDAAVAAMARRTLARVVLFSATGLRGADVVATDVRADDELRVSFRLRSSWGATDVRLGVRGVHQVGNALAAAAVALSCDVPLAAVAAGLGRARLSPWRMELQRSSTGAVILNDAYNASPTSMAAALHALVSLPAQRRVAVVGEMAELGASAAGEHRRIARLAGSLGVRLLAVGTPLYEVETVVGIDEAIAALGPLGTDDAVLVKGSRVVGLERLAARLLAP